MPKRPPPDVVTGAEASTAQLIFPSLQPRQWLIGSEIPKTDENLKQLRYLYLIYLYVKKIYIYIYKLGVCSTIPVIIILIVK